MSEGSALQQLPRYVNPRKLAYSTITLEGKVVRDNLPQLLDAVGCEGDVEVSLQFFISEEGKLRVSGNVTADLIYQCQRCLESMPAQRVEAELSVAIVRQEEEAKQLPVSLDPWLVPEDEGDVYALVEEELLLALPVVAYHDYPCVDAALMSSGEEQEGDAEPERAPNPFQVLESLKQDSKIKK